MVRSGYTHCACRDCMEIVVSNDISNPDFCSACFDAECSEDSECRADVEDCAVCGACDRCVAAPARLRVLREMNLDDVAQAYAHVLSNLRELMPDYDLETVKFALVEQAGSQWIAATDRNDRGWRDAALFDARVVSVGN